MSLLPLVLIAAGVGATVAALIVMVRDRRRSTEEQRNGPNAARRRPGHDDPQAKGWPLYGHHPAYIAICALGVVTSIVGVVLDNIDRRPSPTPTPTMTPDFTPQPAATSTGRLTVPFGPDPAGEIGEFGKRCEINARTGALVLSVLSRPPVSPGQEYAGCCVEFRDLSPGERRNVAVVVKPRAPERELHVKLETKSGGVQVAWIHHERLDAGAATLTAGISNPVFADRVDKFCVAAKGPNSPEANVIEVSGLSFY